MIGLAAEYVFLGGLCEKLGVEVEVERVGEFKGATETLAEREMSEANREMANSLLDSIDAQFVAGIAEGRKLEPEFVRRAIDAAPVSPEQLKAVHLIDGIQFWDELVAELGGKEKLVEADDYARVDPADARLRAGRALRAGLRQRQRRGRPRLGVALGLADLRVGYRQRGARRGGGATRASRRSSSGSTAPAARRWRRTWCGAPRAARARRASR